MTMSTEIYPRVNCRKKHKGVKLEHHIEIIKALSLK